MIDPRDEARLLADLRGDPSDRDRALGELYESSRTAIHAIALRMTGRADLAQDAVQETFVDVLRGVGRFRGDARLTTWLYRVAVRASARVASRSRRSVASLPDDIGELGGGPAEELAQREGAARLLAALAKLPPAQRAVLALSALDDLAQTEIADVLGVPVGTVYSRLHAARERMRQALANDGP